SLTDFNLAIPGNALTLAVLLGLTLRWARTPALVFSAPKGGRNRSAVWCAVPAALFVVAAVAALVPSIAGGAGEAERACRAAPRRRWPPTNLPIARRCGWRRCAPRSTWRR